MDIPPDILDTTRLLIKDEDDAVRDQRGYTELSLAPARLVRPSQAFPVHSLYSSIHLPLISFSSVFSLTHAAIWVLAMKIEYRASDLPADLPPLDRIVQHCAAAGYRQNGTYFAVQGIPRFWIKYGTSITLGEALTQDQVAQIVNADPTSIVRVPQVYLVFLRERCRYIVMQDIAGDTVAHRQPSPGRYANGDVAAVAAAVKQLIGLRVPAGTPPGHVGGGSIGHDFFLECKSTSEYPTVGDLQAQVNKALVLCPSDIDPSNFIVDLEGKVFAIDFGRTGYMPPSYVSYSLAQPKAFTKSVARLVGYPKSANPTCDAGGCRPSFPKLGSAIFEALHNATFGRLEV
ncbi:hypothetical protein F5146DRAFT_1125562 [Armillaria mellea]|nr:hypothetical protein F5146DRAFT_1125562 [Armillaria mellea]